MYQNKKIGLIIPTRYGSERLYGKVLQEISGKKVIERIIERAFKSKYIDEIILAVTDKAEENTKIMDWYQEYKCTKTISKNVKMYVGTHNNIALRTLRAAKIYDIDIIVDTSHDCVCIDYQIIDILIEKLFEYNVDYASNIIVRSFPDGLDLQVYKTSTYERIINLGNVYPYYTGWNIFYCREKIFPKIRFYNLMAAPFHYFPDWHVCLDTEEDLKLLEIIFKELGNDFNYPELINFLYISPELLEINKSVRPTELKQELT